MQGISGKVSGFTEEGVAVPLLVCVIRGHSPLRAEDSADEAGASLLSVASAWQEARCTEEEDVSPASSSLPLRPGFLE